MTGITEHDQEIEMNDQTEAESKAIGGRDTVRQITPPPDLQDRTTLSDVAYQDCFIVDVGPSLSTRTAEQWARAVLEGAPAPMRRALVTGWKGLGLRLGPLTSEDHILGWPVLANDPDRALLASDGRLGLSGELLFERLPHALRFATFVRLDNPAAVAVWAGTRPLHERMVRRLLTRVT